MNAPPLTVVPYNRDYTRAAGFPPVKLQADTFSHDLFGPLEAPLSATGDPLSLGELFRWLGTPLALQADLPDACWWGHIQKVRVRLDGIAYEADLGRVVNKLAVAYSATTPGTTESQRATTTWAQDLLSQAHYGILERLVEQLDSTAEAAEAFRDSLLAADQSVAWPWVDPSPDPGPDEATLTCRGYWDLLLRRYYARTAAGESYDVVPPTVADKQMWGDNALRNAVAESFTLTAGEPFYLANVAFYIQKVSPSGGAWPVGNDVAVEVCPDDGFGNPDFMASIETQPLLASAITPQLIKVTVPFANTNLLAVATPYWVVLGHTGADDPQHYYFVGTPLAAGYAGNFRIFDVGTGTWNARVPDADMSFIVGGTKETTTQIADLVTAVAPYLVGTRIVTASGVRTNTYRNGDSLAADVLLELLSAGTSGGTRLRAHVARDRYLVIEARPAYDRATVPVFLGPGGNVYNRRNQLLGPQICPAGQWCGVLSDPLGLEENPLVRTGRFVVERAEYAVGQGWRVYRESPVDVFADAEG
jgi:hypothetical protein